MSVEQVVVNAKAIRTQAERLTATGWDGDAYRFVESLLLNAVADGWRKVEQAPAPRGPGASREAIDDAQKATATAVRAAREKRKKPLEVAATCTRCGDVSSAGCEDWDCHKGWTDDA